MTNQWFTLFSYARLTERTGELLFYSDISVMKVLAISIPPKT